MKTQHFVLGLVLIGLLVSAPAQAAAAERRGWWGDQQQTEKFAKTVPLAKGGSFDLANISGDVVITGGAGDQVVIDAIKRGRTTEDLKLVQIEVTATASRVEVRTQYPRERRNVNASVDYTITLPRGAVVNVHSVSGDLRVSNVDGALRAETVSGDVNITSAGDLEAAKTVSGDVTVMTSASAGDVSAGSVSGSVVMTSVKARSFDLNSVSGDVRLTDVTAERVKANSISGDMEYAGPLAKGGRYMFQSHSGDVTVTTGDKTGFELNASSFSGDITSAFEMTARVGGENNPEGRRRRQSMRGTFGDGSAVLELNSFSGDIRLVRR